MVNVTIIAVFFAGLVSFASPCIFPLIPGFLAYLSGTGIDQAKNSRKIMFINSIFYVLGFSLVFSLMGVLLNTVLEHVAYDLQIWLSRIGGIVIIFFGLYLTGLIKIGLLQREHGFKVEKKFGNTYLTSFVFGAAFAVGWSPCVGAVLGSILALAITNPSLGFVLLLAYSVGLGLPFLVVGWFSTETLGLIKKLGPYLKYFNIIVGTLLVILGILVFTQTLSAVSNLAFINLGL